MGSDICNQKQKNQINLEEDILKIEYGQDPNQKEIQHQESIKCSNKQLQKHLDNFSESLIANRTLYKDPKLSSKPITLRSKTSQIKCTYERPYKFIQGLIEGTLYRLIDYHDSNPDTIEINDQIMQYFGVFLCFLSNKPNLIRKIILTEENTFGLHCVEAYVHGLKRLILFDDYILCKDGKPMFSKPCKMIYMWPSILEKAWFKVKGSFTKRVEENSPEQLFESFLPLPLWKINIQKLPLFERKEKIREIFNVEKQSKKQYILKSKKNVTKSIGIEGNKYFYLLNYFEHNEKLFFYLRNSSGQKQFEGLYKNVSEEIQQILLEKNYLTIAEGNFIIDLDQFLEQVGEIMVINYIPGNEIGSQSFFSDNNEELFLGFELKHRGPLSLCLKQFLKSYTKKQMNYYPFTYQVIRLSDQKIIGGLQNTEGCFALKNLLDNVIEDATAGKYMIRVKKKEFHKNLNDVQTVIFTSHVTSISFDMANQQQLFTKWKQFLISEGKRVMSDPQSQVHKSSLCNHTICWLGDIVFLYVEKTNQNRHIINIEVNFPQLVNLECISHPEIKKSQMPTILKVEDTLVIIFEKKGLIEETQIKKYNLQSF